MLFQSAGLCTNGADPCTIAHIYNVAINHVLHVTYECAAFGFSDKDVTELEKFQGSLKKTALALSKFCRNSSLMRAMRISSVKQTIDMQYLSTLKNCFIGSSKAKTFYLYLIYKHSHCNMGHTAPCYIDVLRYVTSTIFHFYNLCVLILMREFVI